MILPQGDVVSWWIMPVSEPLSHIIRDEHGVVWLDDTKVKVVEIAFDHSKKGRYWRCFDKLNMTAFLMVRVVACRAWAPALPPNASQIRVESYE
jgi:hypothetical protein